MFRHVTLLRFLAVMAVTCGGTALDAGQNVVVVLDDSGSMDARMRSNPTLSKMDVAKRALLTVLEQLPADARIGIVLLNGDWHSEHWAYPLATVDRAKLRTAINQISAGGGTPLGEYMKVGSDAILSLRDKEHYGSYRLLIVTDGEATDAHLVQAYLPDILSRGVWIDVIGVDMAGNHSLATQVHTYRKADDPASLEQALFEVFAESAGDASDATASDFEVIASIPDELAAAALQALSQAQNHPIGEKAPEEDVPRVVAVDEQGNIVVDEQGDVVLRERDEPSGGAFFSGWGCLSCAGLVLGGGCILALLIVVAAVARKSKRR